jgi:Lamin Tail Domain
MLKGFLFCIFITLSTKGLSQENSIIITEIFADPTPTHGLPEKEYIEIHNASSKTIDLKGFKLLYGSSEATFGTFPLEAHHYAIVCRKGNESELSAFGKVAPLLNFSLPNAGTLLVLKNPQGQDIFFVQFDTSWYSPKKEEGYSLEMIDMNYACTGKSNWTSSPAPLGGSPGAINAAAKTQPDTQAPQLNAFSLDQKLMRFYFDEAVYTHGNGLSLTNFKFSDNTFQISNISQDKYKAQEVTLTLNKPLPLNTILKVSLQNLEDCVGNIAKDREVNFHNLPESDSGDVVLSEILFNPSLGGYDFVEIFNKTPHRVNLKNWSMASLNAKGELNDALLLTEQDLILEPEQFVAFTENKAALEIQFPSQTLRYITQVKKLPALNLDKGGVYLYNATQKLFDSFQYNESQHHALLANPKGVSLEKVNFNKSSALASNWVSASSEVAYATPGYANSQTVSNEIENNFYIENEVFNPFQTNDKMSAFLVYTLPEPNYSAIIEIFDRFGSLHRKLRAQTILGTSGKIEWDGKNDAGNLVPVNYYFLKITLMGLKQTETILKKVVVGSF